ncbi:MAG: acylphosphatase [Terriglobia bacterium]
MRRSKFFSADIPSGRSGTSPVARKYWVSGSVQGVGYRFFAQREAAKLGLAGYVKNLPDGRVEVYALGNRQALVTFGQRLTQGPPGARVSHIEEIEAPASGPYPDFVIEY